MFVGNRAGTYGGLCFLVTARRCNVDVRMCLAYKFNT
jgi:hypothetical protein